MEGRLPLGEFTCPIQFGRVRPSKPVLREENGITDAALTSGKIDVIATNMAITPERKGQLDFSNPVYSPPTEAVVVHASDATVYRSLADLKGFAVGAQKVTIALALLQRTAGFSEIKSL
jgi:ABC-type amino acid transport substrate-binding protein